MIHHEAEKYRKPVRVLHWVHSGAFVLLFLTGLILFVPYLSVLAEGSWTRLIHRIGAAIFVTAPVIYIVLAPKAAARGLRQAFSWSGEDMGWLRAAPRYYFLGDQKGMPPQGFMNTGQKTWWLITIIFGILSIVTGAMMWFGKATAPSAVLQRGVLIHDVSFIVTGVMFFLHLYLGVFHPLMTESWKAITRGKISAEYAKAHHGKWFEEVTKSKEEKAE